MPNVALFKQDGTQNGEITLNEEIFGIEPNESVVYDAIIMQRAAGRLGQYRRLADRRQPARPQGREGLATAPSAPLYGPEQSVCPFFVP